jgi:predicted methyltransferase
MMAHSDQSRRGKNFESSFVSDALKMIASVEDYSNAIKKHDLKIGKTKIIEGDARKINLKDESVDGIITSPPYSIALNYVANDAHSLKALGYDLDKIKEDFIGVRGTGLNKFELYDKDMEKAYSEMYRVLKKDKYCVVVIGNVTFQGQEINTTQNVINYCEKIGFRTIKKMEKIIYGLYNVMQKEYILIFQK